MVLKLRYLVRLEYVMKTFSIVLYNISNTPVEENKCESCQNFNTNYQDHIRKIC